MTCKDWERQKLGSCTACLSCDQYQGETKGRCGTTGCGHWSAFHLRKDPTVECKRCRKVNPDGQRCQDFTPLMDNEDLCSFCKHNLDQHEGEGPICCTLLTFILAQGFGCSSKEMPGSLAPCSNLQLRCATRHAALVVREVCFQGAQTKVHHAAQP
jgi:hypothetical protein